MASRARECIYHNCNTLVGFVFCDEHLAMLNDTTVETLHRKWKPGTRLSRRLRAVVVSALKQIHDTLVERGE